MGNRKVVVGNRKVVVSIHRVVVVGCFEAETMEECSRQWMRTLVIDQEIHSVVEEVYFVAVVMLVGKNPVVVDKSPVVVGTQVMEGDRRFVEVVVKPVMGLVNMVVVVQDILVEQDILVVVAVVRGIPVVVAVVRDILVEAVVEQDIPVVVAVEQGILVVVVL